MNYADLVQKIRATESTIEAETLLHDYVRNFIYTVGVDIGENHDQCNVVVGCKHFAGGPLLIVFAEDLTVTKGKLQIVPQTDYAYPTIEDYEELVGFKVNDAFRMAWAMARTTNDMFLQMTNSMEKNT